MSVFHRTQGTKIDRLIARLNEPQKKRDFSNNFGYDADEKVIDDLRKLGDPAAIPALLAKEQDLAGMHNIIRKTAGRAGPDENSRRLDLRVSSLREKTNAAITALGGREITFVVPCGVCGYKTSVTVAIDWTGNILSGSATDHEFQCQNCLKVFRVSKEVLKEHTSRFV